MKKQVRLFQSKELGINMATHKKLLAKPIIKKIYKEIKEYVEQSKNTPHLKIIVLGEDPAAAYYVASVEKKGKKVGIYVSVDRLDIQTSQTELENLVKKYNTDLSINGIMIQKPLPSHISDDQIVELLDPNKDIDGLHPLNLGNLILEKDGFVPCTPAAVLEILDFYEIETTGKNVVILGRSNIVGKPLGNLLLQKTKVGNSTVTICHSRTKNLSEITNKADILIAAIGKPNFVSSDMIKSNAIVIDVGINQIIDENKVSKYVGDVDFIDCFDKAEQITPVPGGVGSVTTACLLKNALKAYINQLK